MYKAPAAEVQYLRQSLYQSLSSNFYCTAYKGSTRFVVLPTILSKFQTTIDITSIYPIEMPGTELPGDDYRSRILVEEYPNPIDFVKAIDEGKAAAIPSMTEIMRAVGDSAGWTVQHPHAAICSARLVINTYISDYDPLLGSSRRREIQVKWCASIEGDNIRPLKTWGHRLDPKLIGAYHLLFFDMLKDMMILKARSFSFDVYSRIWLRERHV